jgi:hypothetical protein
MRLFTCVIVLLGSIASGCSSTQKQVEADTTYTAEHMHCVDRFNTKQEIDACREAVRIRWQAPRDAGGDQ